VQTTDGVQHAMKIEPAEGNVVESVVGGGEEELIADQNDNGKIDYSSVSNPIDDLGLIFVMGQVDVDRDLEREVLCQ
jgi:hypothetical protein